MTQHIPTRITRKEYREMLHIQQNGIKMFKITRQASLKEISQLVDLHAQINEELEVLLPIKGFFLFTNQLINRAMSCERL
jgi:vacuolar-type H+-ATPase subunit D/Vma8